MLYLFPVVWALALSAPVEYDSSQISTLAGTRAGKGKLLPIVLWHGMGDSCCDPQQGIGTLKVALEEEYGVFVYSIGFGSEVDDLKSSYFGNVNEQVAEACRKLASVKELSGGFDAVGFSQGGQFLRAVVERCHHKLPKIRYLVTLGGQHQGVMSIPKCPPNAGYWCSWMRYLADQGAYWGWPSTHIIQAQYVKDPDNLGSYLEHNIFLPYVNNEKAYDPLLKENFAKLDAFIMFRFTKDTVVVPRDSAWFSFYNGKELLGVKDQPIYQNDWIGLKELDEKGGLIFDEINDEHMRFSWEIFSNDVINKYFLG